VLTVSTKLARSRLAVTVTTKVHKRAVIRNRIKRFAREAFRKMAPEIAEPTDVLAIARFDAVQSSYQDVEADLRRALRSLKLIR
jgi:ribonuclease P protein component